jgi:hypothetical protein
MVNQAESDAKSLKSLKKWFDISPMRVTFKAEGKIETASRGRLVRNGV